MRFRIHVTGCRGEQDLGLGRINFLVGPNGCGQSNLHGSLFLLSEVALGLQSMDARERARRPRSGSPGGCVPRR